MSAKQVRTFYCKYMTKSEKASYLDYLNGDQQSSDWIYEANLRRDKLLSLNLTCDVNSGTSICGGILGYDEYGKCTCCIGHTTHNNLDKFFECEIDLQGSPFVIMDAISVDVPKCYNMHLLKGRHRII
jgi:hypothetical protein